MKNTESKEIEQFNIYKVNFCIFNASSLNYLFLSYNKPLPALADHRRDTVTNSQPIKEDS